MTAGRGLSYVCLYVCHILHDVSVYVGQFVNRVSGSVVFQLVFFLYLTSDYSGVGWSWLKLSMFCLLTYATFLHDVSVYVDLFVIRVSGSVESQFVFFL